MIHSQIIITNYRGKICSFLMNEQHIERLQVTDVKKNLISNIYLAKVKQISKNLNAAFVEIANGQKAFLPFEQIPLLTVTNRVNAENLQIGDELPVQFLKEAVKTKEPVVTANLSLNGRYCVVSLKRDSAALRYSKKLSELTKQQIACYLEQDFPFSVMIRTRAEELSDFAPLKEEILSLSNTLQSILEKAKMRTCYSLLYETQPGYLSFLNELPDNSYERIVTDIPEVYDALLAKSTQKNLQQNVEISLYTDSYPLLKVHSLESKMQELFDRKIYLPSGATLFIEPTEAMTVIDVNTGKCVQKKDKEEMILKINLEAARHIARQMILRNLSGIIIIDFINMSSKNHKEELMAYMRDLLKKDPIPCKLIDITPLGLMEITRKKKQAPLSEQFSS